MANRDNGKSLPEIDRTSRSIGRPDSKLLRRGMALYVETRQTPIEVAKFIPTEAAIFILPEDWHSSDSDEEGWKTNRNAKVYEFSWDGTFIRKHTFRLHSLSSVGLKRVKRRPMPLLKLMGNWLYFREFLDTDENSTTVVANYLFNLATDGLVAVWSNDSFLDDHKQAGMPNVTILTGFPWQWITQSAFGSLYPVRPAGWNGEWFRGYVVDHVLHSISVRELVDKIGLRHQVGGSPPQPISGQDDWGLQEYQVTASLDTTIRHDGSFSYRFENYGWSETDEGSCWTRGSRHEREMMRIFLGWEAGRSERYLLPDPNHLISSGKLQLTNHDGSPFYPPSPLIPVTSTFPDAFPAYRYSVDGVSNGKLLVHLGVQLDRIGPSLPGQTLILDCADGEIIAVRQIKDYANVWWESQRDSSSLRRSLAGVRNPSHSVPLNFSSDRFSKIQGDAIFSTATVWFDDDDDDDPSDYDVIIVHHLSDNHTAGFIPQVPQELAPKVTSEEEE